MSTPGERLVVAMAIKWCEAPANPERATDLIHAVELLQAERGTEMSLTWGQVVVGDEVYGATSGKWFEVDMATRVGDTVRARPKGGKNIVSRPASAECTVRRGAMGKAADMFTTVVWSGRSAPDVATMQLDDAPAGAESETEE